MLDRRRRQLVADARERRVAVRARVAPDADLDELVRGEIDVDLVQHRGCQPVLADADDGMKVVRPGAKRPAFRG